MPQVDHLHDRHRPSLDAVGHDQSRISAALGVLPAFQRGRGRAQQHRHALELCPLDRHVAGVISRDGLLLERAFMFLVDHDQAQPPRRGEDRRSGADDDFDLACRDALPVPMPFDIAQMAVQHGHPGKPPAKPADRLRRQADLRHQHDRLAAPRHHLLDGREVDLGLAAARDSVDQERSEAIGRQSRSQGGHRRFLLARQDQSWKACRDIRPPGRSISIVSSALSDPAHDRRLPRSSQLARLARTSSRRRTECTRPCFRRASTGALAHRARRQTSAIVSGSSARQILRAPRPASARASASASVP